MPVERASVWKGHVLADAYKAPVKGQTPTQVTSAYWVWAKRQEGCYPDITDRSGKWLLFIPVDKVDEWWFAIQSATEKGLLGGVSKVATMKPNPNASYPNMKVICVYTYDAADFEDVERVRSVLRDMGVVRKIPYKLDSVTKSRRYQNRGDKAISTFMR